MIPPTDSLKYLIGGNPGWATHFVAQYLTECGFPTTHESFDWVDGQIIRVMNTVTNAPIPLAECSYTVGEWCDRPGANHIPVISIIRYPYHVLNSLIAKKLAGADVIDIDQIMAEMLNRWKRLKDTGRLVLTVRVEFDLEKLLEFLNLTKPNRSKHYFDRGGYSHARGRKFFNNDDLSHYPTSKRFDEFARQHGYGT